MKFNSRRLLLIRRLVFAALVVLTAVLQQTRTGLFSVGAASAMLSVTLTVCIAMHEKSLGGLFFGVFAGMLWDSGSLSADGFFAIFLAITGFVCAVLIIFKMQNNILSCLLLSFAALFAVSTLHWTFFYAFSGAGSAGYVYFKYYLSSCAFSLIFAIAQYYIVEGICFLTKPKKKRINY